MNSVYQKQLDQQTLSIRYPTLADAQAMCDYINTLSQEQTYIRFQGEQISVEDETKFLESSLEKSKNKKAVMLLAFLDSKLVGISGIDLKDKVEGHEGVFGISVAAEVRGKGIGKALMTQVIEEATKNLPELKIITLSLFANNPLALQMYEKFGFKEWGRLPNGIKHRGLFVDHIFMYKPV